MAELRNLTTHCQFGGYLAEAVRDRLVCRLRNEAIQRKLFTEADFTLARALELSLGIEAAEKNAKPSLKVAEPAVNRITTQPCYRCGKMSHNQKNCRFREADCHKCGKKGHIASVCHSAKNNFTTNARQPQQKRFNRHLTKFVTTEMERDSVPLYTIGGGYRGYYHFMSGKKFKKIFPRAKVDVRLKTYTAWGIPIYQLWGR